VADPETLFGVDLKAVRERLGALEYFTSVDTVQAATEAITGAEVAIPPAAFVSIMQENYAANRYAAGGHAQRATVELSVLFCIPGERIDGELPDEVERARKLILAVLIGWQPPGADVALEARSYAVRMIAEGLVWGEWRFRTGFDMQATPAP